MRNHIDEKLKFEIQNLSSLFTSYLFNTIDPFVTRSKKFFNSAIKYHKFNKIKENSIKENLEKNIDKEKIDKYYESISRRKKLKLLKSTMTHYHTCYSLSRWLSIRIWESFDSSSIDFNLNEIYTPSTLNDEYNRVLEGLDNMTCILCYLNTFDQEITNKVRDILGKDIVESYDVIVNLLENKGISKEKLIEHGRDLLTRIIGDDMMELYS